VPALSVDEKIGRIASASTNCSLPIFCNLATGAVALQSAKRENVDDGGNLMIRKLNSGYRLYSRKKNPKTGKRRNLGTFKTKTAAKKHEKAVQYFKRH
jgi:hypothetical protein